MSLFVLVGADNASAQTLKPALGAQCGIGGGARSAPGEARGALFELVPRGELLFQGRSAAVGPTLEFRTTNFRTAELSAGVMTAFSDGNDLGGVLIGGVGYAWRDGDQNGVVLGGTVGWGLVKLDPELVWSTLIYLSFRHAATGPSRDEITAGLSFGGGIVRTLLRFVHD